MNLISGEITEIFIEEGTTMAHVSVKGASVRVSLMFLPEAHVGDMVLSESGVAISRLQLEPRKDN